ncbi:uncharacterized protein BX664DRAFT_340150 [Halteromyces radiatus]|uniref:uncharacterized protein n=1 Tax=Halteromyces radiatus TaxID=101107 RepID=UPI0022202290|nr:uncharacterized protein BX664DRAFT_340150 [Halteromyces radiatus]KAI8081332.1 hypothetical protein BX664DRAFT_340150 [Halteromyces radiatus]
MDQLVDKIRDVETISQGYTLAPANSTLEQPRSHQSQQTIGMQSVARSVLVPYFKSITGLLQQSIPLTHPVNLSTLRGMYNIKALSSSSSPLDMDGIIDDLQDIESTCSGQLDYLVYMIRSRRREWFMHLLALEMMTLGHDSARQDYETLLETVERMMLEMEQQTSLTTKNTKKALLSDLFLDYIDGELTTSPTTVDEKSPDQRPRIILNKLDLLEKHLRNLQTKIVLCRHDAKGLSYDRGTGFPFERIGERFGSMDQDISYLLAQWDESKNGLFDIISKNERKSTISRASLPSPPSSPAATTSKKKNSLRSLGKVATASTSPPNPTASSSSSSISSVLSASSASNSLASSVSSVLSSPLPTSLPNQRLSSTQNESPLIASTSSASSSSSSPASNTVSTQTPTTNVEEPWLSPVPKQNSLSVPTNTTLSSRQSWITAAAIASFLESRRVYRLQTQQRQQLKPEEYFARTQSDATSQPPLSDGEWSPTNLSSPSSSLQKEQP